MKRFATALLIFLSVAANADDTTTAADLVDHALMTITEVDVDGAEAMIAEGALLIDVREPAEFAAGHLEGAINIPRGVLEFRIAGAFEDSDAGHPVVVYCRSGKRSALATETLNNMGYEGAVSMNGGIRAWEAADRAITTETDD